MNKRYMNKSHFLQLNLLQFVRPKTPLMYTKIFFQLVEKSALLKERLSKLARVLTASYPSYVKWLERIEKIEGSPICKIDPVRRCSLKKPETNRWKFQCKYKKNLKFFILHFVLLDIFVYLKKHTL